MVSLTVLTSFLLYPLNPPTQPTYTTTLYMDSYFPCFLPFPLLPIDSHASAAASRVVLFVSVVVLITYVALVIPFGMVLSSSIGCIDKTRRGGKGCFRIWLWKSYVELLRTFMVAP